MKNFEEMQEEIVVVEQGEFIEDECIIENVSLMCGVNNANIAR